MYKVVLIRHGQSVWNRDLIFTGWVNVALTERGMEEAKEAGEILKKEGLSFDVAYTNWHKRAQETLDILLKEMSLSVPVVKAWQLNERHYGWLQGKHKDVIYQQVGRDQFMKWRRSYDVPPPPIEDGSEYDTKQDPTYKDVLNIVPVTECLADVEKRVMPYWANEIVPQIKAGKKVIISISGNSLRALVKNFDGLTPEEISEVNIPYAVPLVYEFDENMKKISSGYLGDPDEVERRIQEIRDQWKIDDIHVGHP